MHQSKTLLMCIKIQFIPFIGICKARPYFTKTKKELENMKDKKSGMLIKKIFPTKMYSLLAGESLKDNETNENE